MQLDALRKTLTGFFSKVRSPLAPCFNAETQEDRGNRLYWEAYWKTMNKHLGPEIPPLEAMRQLLRSGCENRKSAGRTCDPKVG